MTKPVQPNLRRTLLLLAAIVALCRGAAGASQVVWQIGKIDQSSLEFTLHESAVPHPDAAKGSSDVVFIVGKSDAETD